MCYNYRALEASPIICVCERHVFGLMLWERETVWDFLHHLIGTHVSINFTVELLQDVHYLFWMFLWSKGWMAAWVAWYTGNPHIQMSVHMSCVNIIQHRTGPFCLVLSTMQGLFVILPALRNKFSFPNVLFICEVISNCGFILTVLL